MCLHGRVVSPGGTVGARVCPCLLCFPRPASVAPMGDLCPGLRRLAGTGPHSAAISLSTHLHPLCRLETAPSAMVFCIGQELPWSYVLFTRFDRFMDCRVVVIAPPSYR